MENGWIKIYRSILDNPISTKPNYLAVWVYLLSHANHEDKEIVWNNQKTIVKKGSFIGSIRKISQQFGLSTGTVKYILDYFISEHMIEHLPNNKYSVFIIMNWDKYQHVEHTSVHQVNASNTLAKTNKNYNNYKNINDWGKHKNKTPEYVLKPEHVEVDLEKFKPEWMK